MKKANKNNDLGVSGTPSTLGYRIVSCTSEDPAHPLTAVQSASIRSTGWQSASHPRYPIEFIIDLGSPAEIDTIQFVSHQYKIANRIDLYVAGEDGKFRALGSFQFSDNSFTDFKARELKSATLNGIRAQYIKASIPGCHINGANTSNQVGLISLNVIGRGGSISPSQAIKNQPGQGAGFESNSIFAPNELLEQLERQKRDAVAKEEFKKAENLKQQIDRLRRVYGQVTQLQQQKNEAIAHEDYATAQKLKTEIDFLLNGEMQRPQQTIMQKKQLNNQLQMEIQDYDLEGPSGDVMQSTLGQTQKAQQQMQQKRFQEQLQQQQMQQQQEELQEQQRAAKQRQMQIQQQQQQQQQQQPQEEFDFDDPNANLADAIPPQTRHNENGSHPDDRPIHPSKNALMLSSNFDGDNDDTNQYSAHSGNSSNPKRSNPKPKSKKPVADERPIHPSKSNQADVAKPPPRRRPAQGNSDSLSTEPEELNPQDASEAHLLIDLFGERPVACFFSHSWNLRRDGIQELGKLICGLKDSQKEAFSRYCYIMRHRCEETHKAVFQTAIEAIESTGDALNLSTNDLRDCINQMLASLIPKVGCSQSALSATACQFLQWLCSKDLYDLVVPIVLKPLKNQNQYLVAIAQLKTLNDMIIEKYGVENIPGLTISGVMNFVVPCLEFPRQEVRQEAINLVVSLESIIGSKIMGYLSKINPKTRERIDDAIKEFKQS